MIALLRSFIGGDPNTYIDQKRINMVVQAERRMEAEADLGYRNKVKHRMLQGLTSAELPPLYQREERKSGTVSTFPISRMK